MDLSKNLFELSSRINLTACDLREIIYGTSVNESNIWRKGNRALKKAEKLLKETDDAIVDFFHQKEVDKESIERFGEITSSFRPQLQLTISELKQVLEKVEKPSDFEEEEEEEDHKENEKKKEEKKKEDVLNKDEIKKLVEKKIQMKEKEEKEKEEKSRKEAEKAAEAPKPEKSEEKPKEETKTEEKVEEKEETKETKEAKEVGKDKETKEDDFHLPDFDEIEKNFFAPPDKIQEEMKRATEIVFQAFSFLDEEEESKEEQPKNEESESAKEETEEESNEEDEEETK